MAILVDFKESDKLVISTTGLTLKMNVNVDEFFKCSGLEPYSNIVIHDPSMHLTLAGFPPEFPTFLDVVNELKHKISQTSPKQLIITGSSGGAHTSLLLGHLLMADYVVVFSPYPYLFRETVKKLKDPALFTMKRIIDNTNSLLPDVKPFLNVDHFLKSWNGKTTYYVHAPFYNKWDRRRANYLRGLPKVKIIFHPTLSHSIISDLIRRNQLQSCFQFPYKKQWSNKDCFLYFKNGLKSGVQQIFKKDKQYKYQ